MKELPYTCTWQYNAGSNILSVALSDDGNTILAGTVNNRVICLTWGGHLRWHARVGNQVWRVALNADGHVAVVGTGGLIPWERSGRGLSWFTTDGHLLKYRDMNDPVWGLSISDDGAVLAAASGKQQLVFDSQGRVLWQYELSELGWFWVWDAAVSANGQIIAFGSGNKYLLLYERNGSLIVKRRMREQIVTVAVSGDGTTIAAGDSSGFVYCLDRQGYVLWEQQLAEDGVWTVDISANGTRLLAGGGEKSPYLWLLDKSGQIVWQRVVEHGVQRAVLSRRSEYALVGAKDGTILLFDQHGTVFHRFQASKVIRGIALSPTGERAIAGSEDGIVYGFSRGSPSINQAQPYESSSEPTPPVSTMSSPVTTTNPSTAWHLTDPDTLRKAMLNAYPQPKFEILCLDLGTRFDLIQGNTLETKIAYLIEDFRQRQRYDELVQKVLADHPHLKRILEE